MADVKVIDIDNEQWNIKDQVAREKITNIEKDIVTKDLPEVTINLKEGYTATSLVSKSHYSYGKIHFVYLKFEDINGNNVGTNYSVEIASSDMYPKKETTFMMYDFRSRAILRCLLDINGSIYIAESKGIISGNNECYGELIFAES